MGKLAYCSRIHQHKRQIDRKICSENSKQNNTVRERERVETLYKYAVDNLNTNVNCTREKFHI